MKLTEPQLQTRPAQPYAAIQCDLPMHEVVAMLPALLGRVTVWLKQRGIQARGPAVLRYRIVDMEGPMRMDVGMLLYEAMPGDDAVLVDELPAGRYATTMHSGPPDELRAATRQLLDWGAARRVTWRKTPHGATGEAWVSRVELYLDDPKEEPDMTKWHTELAFMVEG